jgi:hypothetical protein
MCGITRTSAEPPSHHECAVYSAKFCPFLSRPNMKRRDHEAVKAMGSTAAGNMLDRNPGVCAVWTTKSYDVFPDGRGGTLVRVGDPTKVEWFAEGREATRAEVDVSIDSGLPTLRAMCDTEQPHRRAGANAQLDQMIEVLEQFLPAHP